MAQTEFKIGEVATRAGVSVDALRYYERMKLLPRARRTSGGFRLFGSESVERVQLGHPEYWSRAACGTSLERCD